MLRYFGRRTAAVGAIRNLQSINFNSAKKCGEKLLNNFRTKNGVNEDDKRRERQSSEEQNYGFGGIFKKTQFCMNEQNKKTNYCSQAQFVNHRIFNQLMTSDMRDLLADQIGCKKFKFNTNSIVYLISALDTTCGDSDKNKTNFILKKLNSQTNISAKKERIKLDSFQCSFKFCTIASQKQSTSQQIQTKAHQPVIIQSDFETISDLKNKKSAHFHYQENFLNKKSTNDSYFFGQKQNHIDQEQIIKSLQNQQVNMSSDVYYSPPPSEEIMNNKIKIIGDLENKNEFQIKENQEKSNEIIQDCERKEELSSNLKVDKELDQFQKTKLVQNQFNQLEIQQTQAKTATNLNEKTLLINTNKSNNLLQEEQLQQIHKQQSISSTSFTNLTQRDSNCTVSDNNLPFSPPEKVPGSPLLSGSESPDLPSSAQSQAKNVKSASKKYDTASDSAHSESERCIPAGKSPLKTDKQMLRNKVRSNTYKIERKIGDGCSSVVYLAKEMDELNNILSNNLIAIKKFKKRKEHHFESEHKILSLINGQHPNIIKIQSINTSQMEIQSDYCPNGDLLDFVIKRGALRESQARFFFKGVSKAVQYLQQRNICHRDLKLENILLDASFNPVVIDFAFAAFNKPNLTDFIGTDGYQAPEIILKYPYCGFAADNFSLGVMLFEMVMGKPPFQHAKLDQGLYKKFTQENVEYWEVFKKYQNPSDQLKDLINKLLESEPQNRISIDEVLQHPWMSENNQIEQILM
ncbi:Serine/Threonine kinase domain protein (macronuclear) [Tetrahymena thermophila SB210]|uniref:Serine/Threonine kinase domain protein n=1 Tax=Tetrahymena thermophila (strain SB210) TaxID=312017 RepID=Q22NG7_TETTS|nr:Serine/Threonine kinase domain protein [Tetrahymena thermophila SB210]EAR86818.1 Serine/Threonine kinase domain protein [Tetrahymena thermophila SB210]|eukprot:XP_001007063.1 Serine/Threonine kinase domain protein [Tetrahymena thermophila SB210]